MGVSGCCGGACGVDLSSSVDNSRFFQRAKSETPVDSSQGESSSPYSTRAYGLVSNYSNVISNQYLNNSESYGRNVN